MPAISPLTIELGRGGLNSSPNTERVPITDLTEAEGVTFEDDTIKKEGGAAKLNTTVIPGAPTVSTLKEFLNSSGVQKLLAALSDGRYVTINAGGIDQTLKSGLSTDRQVVIVEGYNANVKEAYFLNGADVVEAWDGISATTSPISSPPADWTAGKPTAGVVHRGRMFAWGNTNFRHTIYYSDLFNMQDFLGGTAGLLQVYPGEFEGIVAGYSHLGRLYIFKSPFGIYVLNDSDPTPANWTLGRLTDKVGMESPLAIAGIDSDVMFHGSDGLIHVIRGIQEFGDVRSSALLPDKIINFVRDNTNPARYNRAVSTYYPVKRTWMLAVSQKGVVNDTIISVDLHQRRNPMFRISRRDVAEALTIRRDSTGVYRPIIGDDEGFVWELDKSGRDRDAAGYASQFSTKQIPIFPGGIRRANLEYLELILKKQDGEFNISFDVKIDSKAPYTVTFNIPQGGGFTLGTSLLGTGTLGGGEKDITNLRKRLTGDGRRVKLTGKNNVAGENYSIDAMVLGVTSGSERVA